MFFYPIYFHVHKHKLKLKRDLCHETRHRFSTTITCFKYFFYINWDFTAKWFLVTNKVISDFQFYFFFGYLLELFDFNRVRFLISYIFFKFILISYLFTLLTCCHTMFWLPECISCWAVEKRRLFGENFLFVWDQAVLKTICFLDFNVLTDA